MFYQNLKFPKVKGRAFFYTNFVTTLDGKVSVKKPGYWPIGSKKDYQTLIELRAYADCLIHGGNLAREFGDITSKNIKKEEFKELRKKLGKKEDLVYVVITSKPQSIPSNINATVLSGDLKKISKILKEKGYKNILIEGGPTLLGSFIKENLMDEIFLTIAPKIYGSENNITMTLVEGILFPPLKIKKLKLISFKRYGQELFLLYRINN